MLDLKLKTGIKRQDRRMEAPRLTSVIEKKDQNLDVEVVNISRLGLRFRSDEAYSKGDRLKFILDSNDENASLSISIGARIVNDYGGEAGKAHEYGAKFTRILYWYEMRSIHDFIYAYEKRQAKLLSGE